MTTTTDHIRTASEGAVKQDGTLPIRSCRRCGKDIVWATSKKTGNNYAVDIFQGQAGQWFYVKNAAHTCDEHRVEVHAAANAERQRELDSRIAAGEIVKGQTVEVVKGRKYPIGTTGEVFWVAKEADRYGTVKIGMMSADGEKCWLNIENVKPVVSA